MAVASAGPYASLHLAPDRQPHQHPTTLFFTLFLTPNQQRQSTEGTSTRLYILKLSKVQVSIFIPTQIVAIPNL